MPKHLLVIAVILTGATGCDNVAWGGIEAELKPPPASAGAPVPDGEVAEDGGAVNLAGPILLAGVRDGSRADFVLVGEVHPGTVLEFPDPNFPEDIERLADLTAPGSEWILFSEGVRVGRMFADQTQPAEGFCGPRTLISGIVELVPSASTAERMLALPAGDARDRQYGDYATIAHVYDQRVATLSIASTAIPESGASWPPLGVLAARKHIQAFQVQGRQGQSVAATFSHQDELTTASPGQGAYSLFVMGQQIGATYEEAFRWFRAVETEGKGAPRYFDHLDWDGDGAEDLLLDVFGSNRRWFASLRQEGDSWVRTFQDSCGSGSNAGN